MNPRMHPNEAFGLPKGTIRAILAILIVTTFCVLAIATAALEAASRVAEVVIVAYFVDKAARRGG